MKHKEVIEKLLAFFTNEGIDFALIGAFALNAHGYVRATRDVDFLVGEENQAKIVAFLESLGYETLYRSRGYSNHLHPHASLGRIDLVYVRGETARTILSSSVPLLVFGDISIPVVKPEHLVALKLFAMKNDPARSYRELADIEQILKFPGIDMHAVRSYFEKYGQMEKFDELTRPEKG